MGPQVFRKISDAGKKIQIFWDPDDDPYLIDTIADQIGTADTISAIWANPYQDQQSVDDMLERFI